MWPLIPHHKRQDVLLTSARLSQQRNASLLLICRVHTMQLTKQGCPSMWVFLDFIKQQDIEIQQYPHPTSSYLMATSLYNNLNAFGPLKNILIHLILALSELYLYLYCICNVFSNFLKLWVIMQWQRKHCLHFENFAGSKSLNQPTHIHTQNTKQCPKDVVMGLEQSNTLLPPGPDSPWQSCMSCHCKKITSGMLQSGGMSPI